MPSPAASVASALPSALPSAMPSAVASAPAGATATAAPVSTDALTQYGMQGPHTPLALHAPWLAHLFGGLFIFASIALVILLAVQTTKQEGLSGAVGGRIEASYRVRPGLEQQLARMTGFFAGLFVISATLVALTGF